MLRQQLLRRPPPHTEHQVPHTPWKGVTATESERPANIASPIPSKAGSDQCYVFHFHLYYIFSSWISLSLLVKLIMCCGNIHWNNCLCLLLFVGLPCAEGYQTLQLLRWASRKRVEGWQFFQNQFSFSNSELLRAFLHLLWITVFPASVSSFYSLNLTIYFLVGNTVI